MKTRVTLSAVCLLGAAVGGLAAPAQSSGIPYAEVTIQAGQAPWGKALGDLDGDGFIDALEAGGNQGGSVWWYRWVPGSGFSSSAKYQIGSTGGDDDLQIGDINGDGAPDVVVNGGIYWYLNPRGSGGNPQAAWARHTIDSSLNAHDLVLGDVNADGRTDVLARIEFGATFLYLQGSNPDAWTKISMPNAPNGEGSALADIDGDCRVDIVGNGYWLKQPADPVNGAWTRYTYVSWATGSAVAVADINRDGRPDVFISHSETGTDKSIAWFEGPANPAGTPAWTRHNVGSGEHVHRFHLADMDRDGDLDVVFAEMHQSATDRVGIYRNGGGGASWTLQTLSTQGSHNIAVGDIGSDGDLDVLGANWSTSAPDGGALKYWRIDLAKLGLDGWTYVQADSTRNARAFGLAFGDLDKDGLVDIVAGHYWYRNTGGGMTSWPRTDFGAAAGVNADGMAVLDIDCDGRLDIVGEVPGASDIKVYWLRSTNAQATTWSATLVGTITPPGEIGSQGYAVGQIVRGGSPEIVLTSGGGGPVYSFQVPSNPAGGNWPRTTITSNCREEGIALADLDRDGDLDLVGLVNPAGTTIAWWENPGWTQRSLGTTSGIEADRVAVGDVNGDGRADVVVSETNLGTSGNSVFWYQGPADPRSTTSWTRRTVASNQGSLNSMDVADMNGDGRPDVVTGEHRGSLKVTVWENVGSGASWTAHTVGTGKESHLGARVADLDRDGDLDIVSIAWDSFQSLHVWRNNAGGGAPPPPTPPPAPTGLAATALSSSQINLSWTDAASNETEFRIFRSTSATTGFTQVGTVGANTTSFQNTGLAASTTYYYRVRAANSAGESGDSNTASATTPSGGGAGGVPPAGLQLWLKADAGVTQSGGAVSAWADQSGNGRTASQPAAGSQPALVANGVGGKPAIAFDGTADHLTFNLPVNGWTGMTIVLVSACGQDRTGGSTQAENAAVFWNETASWGTVYLSPFQTNVKFRFGTTQSGNVPSYARPASIGSSFSTTIAVKNGATDSLFIDGTQVVSQGGKLSSIAGCRDTGNLGRGYNDTTYFPGSIAEVLVYDRALSTAERQGVEQYLATRYSGAPPNSPPSVSLTSPASGATFVAPASIAIAASASDADGAVSKVEFFQGATKLGEDTSSSGGWTFSWTGVPAGSYSLTARATDNAGGVTTSTAVPVTVNAPGGGGGSVPASGLQLWLKADAGVTQSGGAVSAWADQSGNGRTASQAAAGSQPALVANALGGKPAIAFDGTADHLTFNLPVNGWTGMTLVLVSACIQDRTGGSTHAESAAVFWNETASWGTVYLSPFQTNVKFRFGTTQTGNLPAHVRPSSIGSAYSTTIARKSGTTDSLYVNGALVLSQGGKLSAIAGCRDTGNLGRGYNDTTYFPGSIAEVLVYNRALSTAERQGVEDYLAARYPGGLPSPALAGAPTLEVTVDSTSTGRPAVLSTAAIGALAYTDRSTPITGLAAGLAGAVLIRTANDDKGVTAADHLRFTVSEPAVLTVGYDRRATTNPAWLNDGRWTITSDLLALGDAGASPMRVFRASVAAGPVVLGGNLAGGGDGAGTHYVVIVQAAEPSAAVKGSLLPETWEHPGDSDGDGLLDGFEAAHLLDPAAADSDGDGTPDEAETAPDGRTYWDLQAVQAAAAGPGDSGESGSCGLLGPEILLLLVACCLLRGARAS